MGLRDGTLQSRGGPAALHSSGLASRGLESQVEQTYLQLLQGDSSSTLPPLSVEHEGSEGELGAVLPIPGATGLRDMAVRAQQTPPEVQLPRSCSYADPAWSTWWLLQLLPVWVGTRAPLRWPPAQGSWDSQGEPRVCTAVRSPGAAPRLLVAAEMQCFSPALETESTFHCSHNWEVIIFTIQTQHI